MKTSRGVVCSDELSQRGGKRYRISGQPWVVELVLGAPRGAPAFPSCSNASPVAPGPQSLKLQR